MAALHQGFVGLAHVFLIRRSSVGVVQGSSGLDQLQQHTMIDCCSLQAAKKLRCNKSRWHVALARHRLQHLSVSQTDRQRYLISR
ncbi:hypothetical protein ALP44_101080 [Pseudomonas syringae pv. theae]|uniref:Uncharacterized protein n=2 Tax=Pseudomonas syringae group TaxID=136849 RepID=A0A3M5T822_9PSED|nr:hypothetical protein ALP44_101080 [Pseudomonas syringae pv. theae]RMU29699.1 hypothetical protein ALP32_101773 [Pseudomonas avellanae]